MSTEPKLELSDAAEVAASRTARSAAMKDAERGAGWFHWIAGLSVINSAAALAFGANFVLIVGLGITQVVDGLALGIADEMGGAGAVRAVAFILNTVFAAGFVLLGWRARKLESWAFVLGIAIYAFDALIFLAFADWISVGFHVFVLSRLWSGMSAAKKARAIPIGADRPDARQMRPEVTSTERARRAVMPTQPAPANFGAGAAGDMAQAEHDAAAQHIYDADPSAIDLDAPEDRRAA